MESKLTSAHQTRRTTTLPTISHPSIHPPTYLPRNPHLPTYLPSYLYTITTLLIRLVQSRLLTSTLVLTLGVRAVLAADVSAGLTVLVARHPGAVRAAAVTGQGGSTVDAVHDGHQLGGRGRVHAPNTHRAGERPDGQQQVWDAAATQMSQGSATQSQHD